MQLWFSVCAEVSLHSSDPVQAAHPDQVSECSAPPSAQGPLQGHTRSVGVRRVDVKGRVRGEGG